MPAEGPRSSTRAAGRQIRGLDGLRAIAIVSVILFHFGVGGVGGGFLGVDLFFVLSGFLITRLLLDEHDKQAGVGLGAFWIRRARRLYPALVVMVAVVTLAALILQPQGLTQGLFGDTLWSLLYMANWHFIVSSSNYFASSTSLFTHLWTLSIEGQFYVVWPLVVIGALRLRRGRLALGLIAGLGALASALLMRSLFDSNALLTRLYEGTDTHSQGLLLGALLAVLLATRRSAAHGKPSREMRVAITVISGAALVGIIVMFASASGISPFLYRGGFLLFSLLSALVIGGVVLSQDGLLTKALALRPIAYVGLISYSLYLWHFPIVLLVTHDRSGLAGSNLLALRVGLTIVLSVLSYQLIERPLRRRTILGSDRGFGLVALALAIASLSFAALAGASPSAPGQQQVGGQLTPAPIGAYGAPTTLADLPAVRPGTRGLLFVGDSMAGSLGNGLLYGASGPALQKRWRFTVANFGDAGCAMSFGDMVLQGVVSHPGPGCDPTGPGPLWPAQFQTIVDRFHPALSVYEGRLDIVDRVEAGKVVHIGQPAFDRQLSASLERAVSILSSKGGRVLLATSPYYRSGEQPDGSAWPEDAAWRVRRYNQIIAQIAARHRGRVGILDLAGPVSPKGRFAWVVDHVPVRSTDGIHWTYQGDAWLFQRLMPQISAWADKAPTP